MNSIHIPFNRPSLAGCEHRHIDEAIAARHISGDGPFTSRCQALLESELGTDKALLTTSCTHALEMTAMLLDIKPGDEVIIPSYTFVSTITAFVLRGAKPVFCDIRPDTLNMNEDLVESLITPATRGIIPVHYGGVGCEMDEILEIARSHGLAVVEDNAHGLFGKYKGKPLGTFGAMAALSFHETKNFNCGEGGALLINDPGLAERAEIIREKGTNRSLFFRGQVDKYSWVDIGSSYLPSDLLAAYLLAQLEAREEIQFKRRRIWKYYEKSLRDWAADNRVRLPVIPTWCEQSYHMFYLLLPSLELRQGLSHHLQEAGILSVSHYQPLHLSKMGLQLGGRKGQCPLTEAVSDQILRLPFYNTLTEEDQSKVVRRIKSFAY